MEHEELQRVFCWKVSAELKQFQYQVLAKSREEIFGLAYQIDTMIRLYELLVEKSEQMEILQLQYCIATPNLLKLVYKHYLQDRIPDNREEGLQRSFEKLLREIEKKAA